MSRRATVYLQRGVRGSNGKGQVRAADRGAALSRTVQSAEYWRAMQGRAEQVRAVGAEKHMWCGAVQRDAESCRTEQHMP